MPCVRLFWCGRGLGRLRSAERVGGVGGSGVVFSWSSDSVVGDDSGSDGGVVMVVVI